eukprot:m51a1_g1787 putative dead deah box helicase (1553) ;mRNA; r:373833-378533
MQVFNDVADYASSEALECLAPALVALAPLVRANSPVPLSLALAAAHCLRVGPPTRHQLCATAELLADVATQNPLSWADQAQLMSHALDAPVFVYHAGGSGGTKFVPFLHERPDGSARVAPLCVVCDALEADGGGGYYVVEAVGAVMWPDLVLAEGASALSSAWAVRHLVLEHSGIAECRPVVPERVAASSLFSCRPAEQSPAPLPEARAVCQDEVAPAEDYVPDSWDEDPKPQAPLPADTKIARRDTQKDEDETGLERADALLSLAAFLKLHLQDHRERVAAARTALAATEAENIDIEIRLQRFMRNKGLDPGRKDHKSVIDRQCEFLAIEAEDQKRGRVARRQNELDSLLGEQVGKEAEAQRAEDSVPGGKEAIDNLVGEYRACLQTPFQLSQAPIGDGSSLRQLHKPDGLIDVLGDELFPCDGAGREVAHSRALVMLMDRLAKVKPGSGTWRERFSAVFRGAFHWHNGKSINVGGTTGLWSRECEQDQSWQQKQRTALAAMHEHMAQSYKESESARKSDGNWSQRLHIITRLQRLSDQQQQQQQQCPAPRAAVSTVAKPLARVEVVLKMSCGLGCRLCLCAAEMLQFVHQTAKQYGAASSQAEAQRAACVCFTYCRDIVANFADVAPPVVTEAIERALEIVGLCLPAGAALMHEEVQAARKCQQGRCSAQLVQVAQKILREFAKPVAAKPVPDMGRFQLEFSRDVPPLMDTDPRPVSYDDVEFTPDGWQRDLLELIRSDKNVLVTTPSSSGKSFVSFFVISRLLRTWKLEAKSGLRPMVVLVAPTLPLVNQMLVYCIRRYGRKIVACPYTAEMRGDLENADVLVCTPQMMEILLLSPMNNMRKRVRCIVFDELHMIMSTSQDSLDLTTQEAYSRLLAMCPCQFLALSATIPNADDVAQWLKSVTGKEVEQIPRRGAAQPHRWADLCTFTWTADDGLVPFHPVSLLGRAVHWNVSSLSLTPEQSLKLYDVMARRLGDLGESLSPEGFFGGAFATRDRCEEYRMRLLERFAELGAREQEAVARDLRTVRIGRSDAKDSNVLRLLQCLVERKDVPALCFGVNGTVVENTFEEILKLLESYDKEQKARKESGRQKKDDEEERDRQKKRMDSDEDLNPRSCRKNLAKGENKQRLQQFLNVVEEYSDRVDPCCCFLLSNDGTALLRHGNDFWVERLMGVLSANSSLVHGLLRGIGCYNKSLPKPYRDMVEVLFRAGQLPVVISTDALAVGVNMPCKTVVFLDAGDHLGRMEYLQMSGRAGRRGFDSFGNVVFCGINAYRLRSLLCGTSAALESRSTIDPVTVLRALLLVNEDAESSKLVARLLHPELASGRTDNHLEQLVFRGSVEVLHELHLVDEQCRPIGLAGMVCHTWSYRPMNLALSLLLVQGIVDPQLGAQVLMQLLAYMFCRVSVRPGKENCTGALSNLPEKLMLGLQRYNLLVTSVQERFDAFCDQNGVPRVNLDLLLELPPAQSLNAYALHFFTEKSIKMVVNMNDMSDSFAYHNLKEFASTLRKIATSLAKLQDVNNFSELDRLTPLSRLFVTISQQFQGAFNSISY